MAFIIVANQLHPVRLHFRIRADTHGVQGQLHDVPDLILGHLHLFRKLRYRSLPSKLLGHAL